MFREYVGGKLYTFYVGDKEFAKEIKRSVRTLAKMKDNPARIKDRGRVLWVKEIYFEELLSGVPTYLTKTKKRKPASGHKRLSKRDFGVLQGGGV